MATGASAGARSVGSYGLLFVRQAAAYSEFRPQYPASLIQTLLQYADGGVVAAQGGEPRRRGLAVDVGTGSGQVAALLLAPHFERVVGLDSSASQLEHAFERENVEYRESPAETMNGVEDGSADLVTVGQALHWFELDAFYPEVQRVLRPGGTFAAWGYANFRFNPSVVADSVAESDGDGDSGERMEEFAPGAIEEANEVFHELEFHKMGPYWSSRRNHVYGHYNGLEPPESILGELEHHTLTMPFYMTLEQLAGYVSTWSSYNTWKTKFPDAEEDPVEQAMVRTAEIFGLDSQEAQTTVLLPVTFPIFLFMARKTT